MPVHYATHAWLTSCGIDLDALGESERVVEDISLVDCDSCLEDVERTREWLSMSAEPSYQVGYEDGKNKAFFEMAEWSPERHGSGCGCDPCLTGSVVARHLAGLWVIEAINVAISGRLSEDRVMQLQERIVGSSMVRELLDAGAWAQAITEAYNQARVAVLTDCV